MIFCSVTKKVWRWQSSRTWCVAWIHPSPRMISLMHHTYASISVREVRTLCKSLLYFHLQVWLNWCSVLKKDEYTLKMQAPVVHLWCGYNYQITSWGTRHCTGKQKDYNSFLISLLSVPIPPTPFPLAITWASSPFSIFPPSSSEFQLNFPAKFPWNFLEVYMPCSIKYCLLIYLDYYRWLWWMWGWSTGLWH